MTHMQPAIEPFVPARRAILSVHLDPNRGRRRSISVRRLLERTATHQGSPHNTAQRLAVEATMAALSPRERACVILRYCEDKPTAEIAEALGICDEAVKKYLGNAVRRLAAVLGPLPDRQIEPIAAGSPITAHSAITAGGATAERTARRP